MNEFPQVCPLCSHNWTQKGRPLKRCPKCRKFMDKTSSPTPPTIVGSIEESPASSSFSLPITEVSKPAPPSNAGQSVAEEKLPEGVSEEQMRDLKESGPIGEAGLALAESLANASPETLTVEEVHDIVVSITELQAIPISLLTGKDDFDSQDEKTAKHLDRASRAGYRLFKRHPEFYKGKVADIIDGVIFGAGLTMPIQAAAFVWVKEKMAENKAKKDAEKKPSPAPATSPPPKEA